MSNENNAINAFIENFNYVNKTGSRAGKRAGSAFIMRLFNFNEHLTSSLETEANDLLAELVTLQSSQCGKQDKINAFLKAVSNHTATAWKHRDLLSIQQHRIESPGTNLYSTLPSTYMQDYDYQRPYPAGKFEENIIAGLEAAAKLLDGDTRKQCEKLAQDIKKYNPVEIISNFKVSHL